MGMRCYGDTQAVYFFTFMGTLGLKCGPKHGKDEVIPLHNNLPPWTLFFKFKKWTLSKCSIENMFQTICNNFFLSKI
jgi:hypothetical protein